MMPPGCHCFAEFLSPPDAVFRQMISSMPRRAYATAEFDVSRLLRDTARSARCQPLLFSYCF